MLLILAPWREAARGTRMPAQLRSPQGAPACSSAAGVEQQAGWRARRDCCLTVRAGCGRTVKLCSACSIVKCCLLMSSSRTCRRGPEHRAALRTLTSGLLLTDKRRAGSISLPPSLAWGWPCTRVCFSSVVSHLRTPDAYWHGAAWMGGLTRTAYWLRDAWCPA